jgi:hypothetical protein|tara:strand:- start:345 stop:638 length:294 start_codon:yes stop_codon:yes gene_type:complete
LYKKIGGDNENMKEIDNIVLMHYAEDLLDKNQTKVIKQAISLDSNLKTKVDMYKKTITLLKKFGETMRLRKKNVTKQEVPPNIVKIADYLKNIKKSA